MKFSSSTSTSAGVVSALTLLSAVVPTESTFQSPPRGATYAASMVLGPDSTIYFTGITYNAITHQSQCFVATAEADPTEFRQFEVFAGSSQDGTATGDSCRSVAVLGGQTVALVGTADPEGYFGFIDSWDAVADQGLPQRGFGMTLHADTLQPIQGTVLSSFARVPYPQAVAGDLHDSEMMYVASMTSNEDTPPTLVQEEEFPNWGHLFQHGTTFALTVEAFSLTEDNGVEKRWTKYFPVDAEDNTDNTMLSSVHVGGIINKPGVGLIIAGATAGKGEAYGSVTGAGTEEDGFLAILDPTTGALYNAYGGGDGFSSSSSPSSQRFGSSSYDIVTDICDDPFDENAFYIVGSTKGDMNGHVPDDVVLPPPGSLQAFIRKVNADTLEAEWTVQLPAYIDATTLSSADALGCAVNNIGSVYVVGQVDNGAGMVERNTIHVSKGGTDMWIARIDTVTAERKWIQQVGSAGDDFVARGGGIVIDAQGNPIVYGDTNGNIYRDRAVYAHHDLFVIRFDEYDGYFAPTLSGDVAGVTQEIFSYYEASSETDPNGVGEIETFEAPMVEDTTQEQEQQQLMFDEQQQPPTEEQEQEQQFAFGEESPQETEQEMFQEEQPPQEEEQQMFQEEQPPQEEQQMFQEEPPQEEQTFEEKIRQGELQFAQELLPEGQTFEEHNPVDLFEEGV